MPQPTEFRINLPKRIESAQLETVARQITPESKQEVLQGLAPAVSHILENSGVGLSKAELERITDAFAKRGTITIPGSEVEGISVNVELNSCTLNTMPQAIRTSRPV